MAKLTLDDVEYETDDFTEEQNNILQEIQYNNRIQKFIESLVFDFSSFIIIEKGRNRNEKSIVLNMPINRVQDEVSNKSGEISIDFLLDKWNKGYKINTSIFENYVPKSTHEEHSIVFQKR